MGRSDARRTAHAIRIFEFTNFLLLHSRICERIEMKRFANREGSSVNSKIGPASVSLDSKTVVRHRYVRRSEIFNELTRRYYYGYERVTLPTRRLGVEKENGMAQTNE